ncbi:uncharacterized protein J7T54_004251 [Emericellopsis cladophorae]|uniref:Uncharacterized protein n=1 Tax=Emericellopsis cladophorae TaxID=2686198 RepID=A0A9P9XYB5_9HYPO|nr:uncharacterized protein J7T54_004251 [Emericellopsis cladophorae]KAI6780118.1 hypothetical protein J7T54_004251 [Emericellopsis cladophorae]
MDAKKESDPHIGPTQGKSTAPSGRDYMYHQKSTLSAHNLHKRRGFPGLLIGDEPEPETQFTTHAIKASGIGLPQRLFRDEQGDPEESRRHSEASGSRPTPEYCSSPHIPRPLVDTIAVRCPHEAHEDNVPGTQCCPFSDLKLELFEAITAIIVAVKWISSLNRGYCSEDRCEACKKTIGQLNELCPEAFGPPIMTPCLILSLTREDLKSSGTLTIDADRCLCFENIDRPT